MDPRVRALLEPRQFAKAGKATTNKGNQGSADSSPHEGNLVTDRQTSRQNISAANKQAATYSPKALLDPRGAGRPTKTRDPSPYLSLSGTGSEQTSGRSSPQTANQQARIHNKDSGSRSMIESLYGVERRADRPAKRVKRDPNQNDGVPKGKSSTRPHNSSGIVGEYMRGDADDPNRVTKIGRVVDLTNEIDIDDTDDDLKVVRARNVNNEKEVCYGMLNTIVQAHAVPKPQFTVNLYGDDGWLPSIKCTAVRVPSKDLVIEVHDPDGFAFGRLEPEVSKVLAPLMDNVRKFRTQLRLLTRKKRPDERPHQPCSEHMKIIINVYGRKADVEKVGKAFGQHNIWFLSPIGVDVGIETENPHSSRLKNISIQARPAPKTHLTSGNRTVEEATEAVTKLFDHYANTTKPLDETEALPMLVTPLLSHQKQALTFMLQKERPRCFGELENENSSLWRKKHKANGAVVYEELVTGITFKEEPEQVFGGLLADVMGLGKTLEALSLIVHTKEEADRYGEAAFVSKDQPESEVQVQSKATLIVAPVSTVKNWEDQIGEHVQAGSLQYYTYHGQNRERNPEKLAQYDIVISTYSTIAAECSGKNQMGASPIKAIRWFRIILDEAHTIREPRASQSQAMYNLSADRRWCLTGTPIQNRLDDLGSLTRFLRLYPYDTTMRFNQHVRSPAQSGDDNYLKSLRVLIDSFTLRRLKDRIDLPDRKNLVEKLKFSEDEAKLHMFFKELASVQIEEMAEERKHRSVSQHHVLRAIMTLRLICDHGRELLKESDLKALKGESEADAIDVDSETSARTITSRAAYDTFSLLAEADLDMCRQCDKKISGDSPHVEAEPHEEVRGYILPCFDLVCTECFQASKDMIDGMDEDETMRCPFCSVEVAAQYVPIPKSMAELAEVAPEDALRQTNEVYKQGTYTGPSTKVKALLDDLNEIKQESVSYVVKGEPPLKSVVFSEFTSYLDLIETAFEQHGFKDSYVRIDGSMSLAKRKKVLDELQTNDNATILLASIKAAGQGLNLTAASRAFIMEPMWNPAAEIQAVDRIHRIGQKRSVTVKRYRMDGSIEEKIVLLQDKKQKLADISMNKNHNLLSKKETREKQMKEILALFK